MPARLEVLVVGAGPAGAMAAWRLATAGVRVRLIDRERFPRPKLCGDTLNPGAVALLDSLPLKGSPLASALPLTGMLVTGPGARVEARYGDGIVGRAIERRVFDAWLLAQATDAGAVFDERVIVRGPLVEEAGSARSVRGVRAAARGADRAEIAIPAVMTLAADGRASVLARAMGLASHPPAPRRWAFGTYASGVAGVSDIGEMHIRGRRYIGVAPVPGGLSNVCVVTGPRPPGRTPLEIVRAQIDADDELRARFARARFEAPVSVLGPLAVASHGCGVEGLLVAGDAAGFVDPMTGDGLHLAMRGGLLAAEAILLAMETGDRMAAARHLAATRASVMGRKLRFNRMLRELVDAPAAVAAASVAARVAPSVVRWAVRYAGDAA
jgi:flavin-dependent dehydrogenase